MAIEFAGPLAVNHLVIAPPPWILCGWLSPSWAWPLLPLGLSGSTLDPLGVLYAVGRPCSGRCTSCLANGPGTYHAGQSVSLEPAGGGAGGGAGGRATAGAALLSPSVLLVGVAVAAISSALPISLEMMALKRLPKEAFGIMISMEPAVAALLALVCWASGWTPSPAVARHWLHRGCIDGQRH